MKKTRRFVVIILLLFASLGAAFLFFRIRYTEQELIIRSTDREIYGHLFRPRFAGTKYPLVVLGHGYGGSYSDNLDYGRYFAEHGIACYVFDFCGGSEDSRSSTVDMNVYTEIEDMNGIVDHMLQQPFLEDPLKYTKEAAEAYDNAEIIVMEGSGHGFKGAARLKVKEKMVEFIRENER